MLVTRSSPVPRETACFAHSMALSPVAVLPPWVKTSQCSSTRRASIATTMHWLPNFSAASEMRAGFLMAAVLREILSAPARRHSRMVSTERMPPPTVKGMNTFSATFSARDTTVGRSSLEAVMSRNTSSSAPWQSYSVASSTGSPASRIPTKLIPLTTLPSLMSRHGMRRTPLKSWTPGCGEFVLSLWSGLGMAGG